MSWWFCPHQWEKIDQRPMREIRYPIYVINAPQGIGSPVTLTTYQCKKCKFEIQTTAATRMGA